VCVCVWMDTMSEIFLMHLLMGLAEWTVYTAKTKWLCMASKVYVSACVFLCTLWKGFSVWQAYLCVFSMHTVKWGQSLHWLISVHTRCTQTGMPLIMSIQTQHAFRSCLALQIIMLYLHYDKNYIIFSCFAS